MRIDKFICECTNLSRSEAKKSLARSDILCNDNVIKNPGHKVSDDCIVMLDGKVLRLRGFRYIMLHKPVDTICSTIDEYYPSVLNLLKPIDKIEKLSIAGRLDADTTGLVLITDDGQWVHRVAAPVKQCEKRYRVMLAMPLNASLVSQFDQGIQLKGEKLLTRPSTLNILASREALLTLSEGKYHQVKRMFAAVGNKVTALHREKVGDIRLDNNLKTGEWRYLTPEEIASV